MRGAVAQLGERLTGSQKVEGSNPSSSTKEDKKANAISKGLSIGPDSHACSNINLYHLTKLRING